jgi:hypothetical protein
MNVSPKNAAALPGRLGASLPCDARRRLLLRLQRKFRPKTRQIGSGNVPLQSDVNQDSVRLSTRHAATMDLIHSKCARERFMPTTFAKKLAATAQKQYDLFHFDSENDPPLANQIEKYWTGLGLDFPGVETAWSAVFISWCVKQAGATQAEFNFNAMHSQFVFTAIKNATNNTGVFRAFDIADYAPQVGDLIHNNRDGNTHNFAFAKTHKSYPSHSAIVVEVGTDSQGGYAMTIGGNESDSIRQKLVRLTASGKVKQRVLSPYICVIQDLK